MNAGGCRGGSWELGVLRWQCSAAAFFWGNRIFLSQYDAYIFIVRVRCTNSRIAKFWNNPKLIESNLSDPYFSKSSMKTSTNWVEIEFHSVQSLVLCGQHI